MKTLILQRFGIINYAQLGEENEKGFTGIVIYRNAISYVLENEILVKNKAEEELKKEPLKSIVEKANNFLKENEVVFVDKRKKFVFNKVPNFKNEKFDNIFYEKFAKGNPETPEEEKIKLLKENILFLYNDLNELFSVLGILDKKEAENFSKTIFPNTSEKSN